MLLRDRDPGVLVAWLLLLLLLALDALFIGLNIVFLAPDGSLPFVLRLLRLGREFGVPELFMYLKWMGACVVMARLYHVERAPLYAAWSGTFSLLLLDDALAVHERIGGLLARAIDPTVLAFQHAGELAVLVTGGLAVLAVLSYAWRRTADGPARDYARTALVLLILLAVCGVGFDALHSLGPRELRSAFLIAEDGGEMLVATLLAAHALAHGVSRGAWTGGS